MNPAAVSVSFRPNNTRTITSSFVGAQPGDGIVQPSIKSPGVVGNSGLGVQLYQAGRFELKAESNIEVDGAFLVVSGSARIAYHF
jgi:hypothetical protein